MSKGKGEAQWAGWGWQMPAIGKIRIRKGVRPWGGRLADVVSVNDDDSVDVNPLRDASGVRTFYVGEFDWIKRPDAKRDHRSCFDCDHAYRGGIKCPACGNASGEPLEG